MVTDYSCTFREIITEEPIGMLRDLAADILAS
jgi:hypothetical protein